MIDHAQRKQSIGASEIASMLGLCEYRSPYQLWMEKTGRAKPFLGNEDTRRGSLMEPVLVQMLNDRIGADGYVVTQWDETQGIDIDGFRHVASPDCFVTHPDYCDGGAELKTAKGYLPDFESVKVKHPSWYLQVQHCMTVTGRTWWILAWMHNNFAFNYEFIGADPDLQARICKEIKEWYTTHVIGDTPPAFDRVSDLVNFGIAGKDYKAVGFSALELVREYDRLKDQLAEITEAKNRTGDVIKMLIGESEGVTFDGRRIATFKADKRGNRTLRTYAN